MNTIYIVASGLIGLCVGSFLNVVADRIPAGGSIVSPPSHCPGCGRQISPSDLIPVLSYLVLRGRCRQCGASIPKRVPIIEAVTGGLFLFSYIYYGLTASALVHIFYFCLFLTLMVIDLEYTIIPNKIVYPTAVAALVISTFTPGIGILNALIGGGAGFVVFLVIALVSRGGMGLGDVKMATLIGFAVGFPMVFVSLLMAVMLGGIVAILLLVARLKKAKEGIPFAPYLSLATMITLVWGVNILDWYLKFFFFF
jgi:leader peptidase (prepilin peptidase) / N-methyltransferase